MSESGPAHPAPRRLPKYLRRRGPRTGLAPQPDGDDDAPFLPRSADPDGAHSSGSALDPRT